jgi:hypothetical protein
MFVELERLIYTNHECGGALIVRRKPALGKHNLRCAGGSELKKYYAAPEVRIVTTVSAKKDGTIIRE